MKKFLLAGFLILALSVLSTAAFSEETNTYTQYKTLKGTVESVNPKAGYVLLSGKKIFMENDLLEMMSEIEVGDKLEFAVEVQGDRYLAHSFFFYYEEGDDGLDSLKYFSEDY